MNSQPDKPSSVKSCARPIGISTITKPASWPPASTPPPHAAWPANGPASSPMSSTSTSRTSKMGSICCAPQTCFRLQASPPSTSRKARRGWWRGLESEACLRRATNRAHLRGSSLSTIHITQSAAFLGARIAWLRDWLARRCLCAYQGPYVAVQETRRKELSDFLRNGHATRSIFNGVPMLALDQRQAGRQSRRRELNVQDDQLLVLDVGRMEAQKRPMLFLELAGRLHQRAPRARFVWIGDGSLTTQWDAWVAEHK